MEKSIDEYDEKPGFPLWPIVLAVVLSNVITIFCFMIIREQHDASKTRKRIMLSVVESKATIANGELEKYASSIVFLSEYIHGLYEKPGEFKTKVVPATNVNTPAGAYSFQRAYATPQITSEDVKPEFLTFGNLEQVFVPIMNANNAVIMSIYAATEKGFMVSYDKYASLCELAENSEVCYNFFERDWYRRGKEEKGVYFTGAYADSFNRGLTITCACPFKDDKGRFAGVVAMDILLTDLYESVVDMNLQSLPGTETFLLDSFGNMISPQAVKTGTMSTIMDEPNLTESALRTLMSGENGVVSATDGTHYFFSRIPATNWRFCIHAPPPSAPKK